jgi:hypothetical protein
MSEMIDQNRTETLEVALFMGESPLAQGPQGIERLLDVIEGAPSTFVPDQVAELSTSPYTREKVRRVLASKKKRAKASFALIRSSNPNALYTFNFVESNITSFWCEMTFPLSFFEDRNLGMGRSKDLVAFLRALSSESAAIYGFAHPYSDLELAEEPHRIDPFAPVDVQGVYWLNVLGAGMVDRMGRSRVTSTPGVTLEDLPNGAVLMLTRPTPADWASEEAREAQARALSHLRDDAPYETVLARLRERSARLAPVKPDWAPEIADLIDRVVHMGDFANRAQVTAKWNRYRPPPVTEVVPAADAAPSNVTDPTAEVRRYETLFAEQLIALLHKYLPDMVQPTPDTLPKIDHHFWQRDYAVSFPRETIENDLVPAVGGYLGELMVRTLGGRWVPRQNLDETQVVIGDRAWLPFLRARHALATKQDAIDHSLTQFYRAAADAAGR